MLTATNNQTSWYESVVYEAKLSGKASELIQGIYRRQIITDRSREVGIELTEEEVQLAADHFRTVNQLETAKATVNWLQTHFLSVKDLEQIVTCQLLIEKLAHHLFADQVEHFFQQNLLEYSGTTIYEVVLKDKYLATELFYAIEEGDLTFADVAHQYIADPELKRRGGYLGTIKRNQLRPEISAAVFAATPPQLIKPVLTTVGIHLIYVEEIIQPQLDHLLYQQILMEMFDLWLSRQVTMIATKISIEV
jgi:parvulin-like peptidyl-prolyl isomerase